MTRPFLALTALLALSPAQADPLPEASADALRAHVQFLSDDLLEGRAAGSRGYDLAARYVASQMLAAGLEPAGDDGGWLQQVELLEATRVLPAARLVVHRARGRDDALEPVADFIPGFWFGGHASDVTAPAVFLGYGIHAPALDHDDFAGVDVAGKIAVVLDGAPARFPASQRAHYSSRSKVEALAARDAVGIVSIDTPEEEQRVPWARKQRLSWVPRMRLLDAAGEPRDAYLGIRGSASVSRAAAHRLFAGSRDVEELFRAAREDRSESFELPARLTLSLRNTLNRATSANVVGMLRGADAALADEYIVFTAHLDHIGRGAAVNGDVIYNGALDNATGIAMMLETARMLAASRIAPRRSLLFVAVTAEERGLLGSDHFARNPSVPGGRLVANVNTDMPVALYPVAGLTLYGAEHTTLGPVARAALAAEGLVEAPDEMPEEVIFVRSDQYSFVRQGIPAIYVDTGAMSSDPLVDAAALRRQFLLRDYHMPSDEITLPIHWPSLARHARVNARLGLAIANDDGRPAWLPGDFFGETFGRREQD